MTITINLDEYTAVKGILKKNGWTVEKAIAYDIYAKELNEKMAKEEAEPVIEMGDAKIVVTSVLSKSLYRLPAQAIFQSTGQKLYADVEKAFEEIREHDAECKLTTFLLEEAEKHKVLLNSSEFSDLSELDKVDWCYLDEVDKYVYDAL